MLGALLVAVLAGFATLAIGQLTFALIRSPLVRAIIALVFAAPAAIAGYCASFGLLQIGIANEAWCTAFALLGATLIGMTAFMRLAAFARPEPSAGPAAVHS